MQVARVVSLLFTLIAVGHVRLACGTTFTFPCDNGTYSSSSIPAGSTILLWNCPKVASVYIGGNESNVGLNGLVNVSLDFRNCSMLSIMLVDFDTTNVVVTVLNCSMWNKLGVGSVVIVGTIRYVHYNLVLAIANVSVVSGQGLGFPTGVTIENATLYSPVISITDTIFSAVGNNQFFLDNVDLISASFLLSRCTVVSVVPASIAFSRTALSQSSVVTIEDCSFPGNIGLKRVIMNSKSLWIFRNVSMNQLFISLSNVSNSSLLLAWCNSTFDTLALTYSTFSASTLLIDNSRLNSTGAGFAKFSFQLEQSNLSSTVVTFRNCTMIASFVPLGISMTAVANNSIIAVLSSSLPKIIAIQYSSFGDSALLMSASQLDVLVVANTSLMGANLTIDKSLLIATVDHNSFDIFNVILNRSLLSIVDSVIVGTAHGVMCRNSSFIDTSGIAAHSTTFRQNSSSNFGFDYVICRDGEVLQIVDCSLIASDDSVVISHSALHASTVVMHSSNFSASGAFEISYSAVVNSSTISIRKCMLGAGVGLFYSTFDRLYFVLQDSHLTSITGLTVMNASFGLDVTRATFDIVASYFASKSPAILVSNLLLSGGRSPLFRLDLCTLETVGMYAAASFADAHFTAPGGDFFFTVVMTNVTVVGYVLLQSTLPVRLTECRLISAEQSPIEMRNIVAEFSLLLVERCYVATRLNTTSALITIHDSSFSSATAVVVTDCISGPSPSYVGVGASILRLFNVVMQNATITVAGSNLHVMSSQLELGNCTLMSGSSIVMDSTTVTFVKDSTILRLNGTLLLSSSIVMANISAIAGGGKVLLMNTTDARMSHSTIAFDEMTFVDNGDAAVPLSAALNSRNMTMLHSVIRINGIRPHRTASPAASAVTFLWTDAGAEPMSTASVILSNIQSLCEVSLQRPSTIHSASSSLSWDVRIDNVSCSAPAAEWLTLENYVGSSASATIVTLANVSISSAATKALITLQHSKNVSIAIAKSQLICFGSACITSSETTGALNISATASHFIASTSSERPTTVGLAHNTQVVAAFFDACTFIGFASLVNVTPSALTLHCNRWNHRWLLPQHGWNWRSVVTPQSDVRGSVDWGNNNLSTTIHECDAAMSVSRSPSSMSSASVTAHDVVAPIVPRFEVSATAATVAAVGVMNGVLSGTGSSLGLPMMQLVVQRSLMQQQCAANSNDDGSNSSASAPLMSDYIDNPLQIHIDALGDDMAYLGGSLIANLLMLGIMLMVKIIANSLLLSSEDDDQQHGAPRTSFLRRLLFVVTHRHGLPGTTWEPYAMVSQTVVAASVAALTLNSSAGLSVMAGVFLTAAISLFVWFVYKIIPTEHFLAQSVLMERQERLSWFSVMVSPVSMWIPKATGGCSERAVSFLHHYEDVFAAYGEGRQWFFAVEAVVALGSGVVNGLSMGIGATPAACDLDWAFTASLLALCIGLVIGSIAFRPYNVPSSTVLSALCAMLAAASLVTLLISQIDPSIDTTDLTNDFVMAQSVVSLINILIVVYHVAIQLLKMRDRFFSLGAADAHGGNELPSLADLLRTEAELVGNFPLTGRGDHVSPSRRFVFHRGRLTALSWGDEPQNGATNCAHHLDDVHFGLQTDTEVPLRLSLTLLIRAACDSSKRKNSLL